MIVGSRFKNRFMTCRPAWAVASVAPPAMTTVRSPVPLAETGRAEELREAADEPDGRRGAERGEVVLIDAVAQAGVADLVQAEELVQAERAARPA